MQNFKFLASLCSREGWFESQLFGNIKNRLAHDRDFLTFLKSGPGACRISEKGILTHQNLENLIQSERTGPPVKL